MNNWSERLNAKVRAYNKVNARAKELQGELLAIFRPFVGKKILTNSGFVAKLKPQWDALRERERGPNHQGFQLYPGSTSYSLTFTLKAWEPYQGEQHGGAYAEATIHVGELGRGGSLLGGDYRDLPADHLAKLHTEPLKLRTDYNADEVRDLRIEAKKLEERAREAQSALYPFGQYDN
jgi:hypothetical protein